MPGHKHVAFANACKDALPKYLVCTAPSKTFNLATLQTSNIVIPDEELRTKFQSILQQHFTPSAGALGLEACRLGYTECEGWLAEVIDLIYKNYKNFCKFIDVNCPGVTYSDLQGTYLMWIDCTTFGLDDEALDKLLRKHDLFCDAGTLFSQGGTMHTRVNLAGPEKMLNAAMQRFKDAYDEAKYA
jgi:aminotransferase/cystathionine beta-lyase